MEILILRGFKGFQAEIVVGDRRVISFLAYPLIRGLDESLREP